MRHSHSSLLLSPILKKSFDFTGARILKVQDLNKVRLVDSWFMLQRLRLFLVIMATKEDHQSLAESCSLDWLLRPDKGLLDAATEMWEEQLI